MKRILTLLFTLGLAFSLGVPVYAATSSGTASALHTQNLKKKKGTSMPATPASPTSPTPPPGTPPQ